MFGSYSNLIRAYTKNTINRGLQNGDKLLIQDLLFLIYTFWFLFKMPFIEREKTFEFFNKSCDLDSPFSSIKMFSYSCSYSLRLPFQINKLLCFKIRFIQCWRNVFFQFNKHSWFFYYSSLERFNFQRVWEIKDF